ncbi:hypothetical protein AB0O86_31630 [Streptomyces hirsutus]|uniref:hypothetical protein n=1 Tax=Streptomyces hirsutus TaxID=35620 RepID=UPI003432A2D2
MILFAGVEHGALPRDAVVVAQAADGLLRFRGEILVLDHMRIEVLPHLLELLAVAEDFVVYGAASPRVRPPRVCVML